VPCSLVSTSRLPPHLHSFPTRRSSDLVVYISHRLEEIRRIGDRITVLKDGRTVATGLPAKDTPTSELISWMTGREVVTDFGGERSEEHTSELQSRFDLVCRLLLAQKNR